jgi:hypothetical protein
VAGKAWAAGQRAGAGAGAVHLHPLHGEALVLQAPVASAAVERAQGGVAEPAESAQAVIDGDEDDGGLLDEVAALVHGVSAGRRREGVGDDTERASMQDETHAAPPLVQLPPCIHSMTGRGAAEGAAAAGAKTLRKRQSSD